MQHGCIHPLPREVQRQPGAAGQAVLKALRVRCDKVGKAGGLEAVRLGFQGHPGRAGGGIGQVEGVNS